MTLWKGAYCSCKSNLEDVSKSDYIIDLGPDGGVRGLYVRRGRPTGSKIITYTKFLKRML